MHIKFQSGLNLGSKAILLMGATAAFSIPGAWAEFKTDAKRGGFKVFDLEDQTVFMTLNGQMKFDQNFFDTQNITTSSQLKTSQFPNGANLRTLELNLSGGLKKNWSYVIETGYGPKNVEINGAYLQYTGFQNAEISLGQLYLPFGLENTNSGKWLGFLERSAATLTFSPPAGLGLEYKTWRKNWLLDLAIAQPKHSRNANNRNEDTWGSDRWTYAGRLVYNTLPDQETVLHAGLSMNKAHSNHTDRHGNKVQLLRFSARPEAMIRSPQATSYELLSTPKIRNSYHITSSAECAWMKGPWLTQAEYMQTRVRQIDNPIPHLKFNGWYLQSSYVLTGESHDYNPKNGAFGKLTPHAQTGAWEIAARYSYLNLNDYNIQGGSTHNAGLGLSWYVNPNVRFMSNYIQAHKSNGANRIASKGKAHVVGLRAQVVW